MKMVPLTELTDDQWYDIKELMFDPSMGSHMGTNPQVLAAKPDLEDFYRMVKIAYETNRYNLWAITDSDGEFLGYVVLDKGTFNEWEIGAVLADPDMWSSGVGVKATLRAMKWVFEEDNAEWLLAFTQGKDPRVRNMLIKGGFRPLSNSLVMDKPTWNDRWAGRL